jgi:hypothetical protein
MESLTCWEKMEERGQKEEEEEGEEEEGEEEEGVCV